MAPKTEILAHETGAEAREKRHDSKPHELICVWRTQYFAIHQAHAKTGATWLIAHFRTLRRSRKETKSPFIPTKRRGNKSLYGSPHGAFMLNHGRNERPPDAYRGRKQNKPYPQPKRPQRAFSDIYFAD